MSESGGGGRRFFSTIISLGVFSLILWLSLRTPNPKCSVQEFYLPALNKSLNNPSDTTLEFQLKLKNTDKVKGVYYDDLNMTIFDFPNRSHVIGSSVIPAFYQGRGKTARKNGSAVTDKEVVLRAVFVNGSAVFRVDLVTEVRFKGIVWKTKRHRIVVGADVEVNADGRKVNRGNVRLTSSSASKKNVGDQFLLAGALFNFLLLIFG